MLSVDRLQSKHWQKPGGLLGDRLERQCVGPSLGWVQTPGRSNVPCLRHSILWASLASWCRNDIMAPDITL